MTLETDLLLDRRRLKRRLFGWRIAAVIAVIVAVLLLVGPSLPPRGDYVARVSIDGLISSDRKPAKELQSVLDDNRAKALILAVDSPGGAITAGESLHDLVERVAAKKPVVVVMGSIAASAGYMISVPAQHIFAHATSLTGSIGVLVPAGEVSGLLRMLGITDETMVSGPLKDEPSLTRPMSDQARKVMQDMIQALYEEFVTMVAKGRNMDPAHVRELADGRAYTGRQALKLGLIDAIGGETEARAWLASAKGIDANLPVRDVGNDTLRDRILGGGPAGILNTIVKTLLSQSVSLDGAWAVWQPAIGPNRL